MKSFAASAQVPHSRSPPSAAEWDPDHFDLLEEGFRAAPFHRDSFFTDRNARQVFS